MRVGCEVKAYEVGMKDNDTVVLREKLKLDQDVIDTVYNCLNRMQPDGMGTIIGPQFRDQTMAGQDMAHLCDFVRHILRSVQ